MGGGAVLGEDLKQFLNVRILKKKVCVCVCAHRNAYMGSIKGSFVNAGTCGSSSNCFLGSPSYVGTLDRCSG